MEQKKYTNGEVTIVWQPKLCIHAAFCAKELSAVFKPKDKPWIQPENASTVEIVNQVRRCPSGALSYYMNADENASITE